MIVHIVAPAWVKLDDQIVVVPTEVFDETHFVPGRRPRLAAVIARRVDADVFPTAQVAGVQAIGTNQMQTPTR